MNTVTSTSASNVGIPGPPLNDSYGCDWYKSAWILRRQGTHGDTTNGLHMQLTSAVLSLQNITIKGRFITEIDELL